MLTQARADRLLRLATQDFGWRYEPTYAKLYEFVDSLIMVEQDEVITALTGMLRERKRRERPEVEDPSCFPLCPVTGVRVDRTKVCPTCLHGNIGLVASGKPLFISCRATPARVKEMAGTMENLGEDGYLAMLGVHERDVLRQGGKK